MRSSRRTIVKTLFAGLAAAIATPISSVSAQTAGKPMTTPSGLQIIDSNVGTGASPKPGQICVMHYTGWLYENGQKGKKFDFVDRNEPFEFPIGQKKGDRRLGQRRRHHEGRRQTHADHPACARLRRAWRRRCHSAECDADVRRRIAGGEVGN